MADPSPSHRSARPLRAPALDTLPPLDAGALPSLRQRLDGAWVAVLPLAWVLALWTWGLAAEPRWGDDWAGYLMQALALHEGAVGRELVLNTLAMQGSDSQIGPYAYPWGYPVMLQLAGSLGGWELASLKGIGGLSLAGLALATFFLARLRVGAALAALATVLTCGQQDVLVGATFLMSDVPFGCLATLAFALVFTQHVRSESRALSWSLTLAIAVAATAAFAVRSNGAVLHATYIAALALVALRRRRPWRETLRHGFAFAAGSALLVVAYFAAWPDGSLVHASYLSLDPATLARRLVTNLEAIWYWFPFGTLPGAWKLLTTLPALVLLLCCAHRRPWDTALVGVYAAGHLALLTLFPFDGGGRYYIPLLAPFFLLLAIGARELAPALPGVRAATVQPLLQSPLARAAPALLAALALTLVARAAQTPVHDAGPDAPLGAAAERLAAFIDRRVPENARIGFFRPRGLRLLTGRIALGISDPRHLDRVDWYVWTRESRDQLRQVPLESLARPGSGFVRVRDEGPFIVFARTPLRTVQRLEARTLRARGLLY
jgi:hypothetical protein